MPRVNDIHSQLNETSVADVAAVSSVVDVQQTVLRAAESGLPVAIAGGRHAMGGQQFCSGGVLVDALALAMAGEPLTHAAHAAGFADAAHFSRTVRSTFGVRADRTLRNLQLRLLE